MKNDTVAKRQYAVFRRSRNNPRKWHQCWIGEEDCSAVLSTFDRHFAQSELESFQKSFPEYLYMMVELP